MMRSIKIHAKYRAVNEKCVRQQAVCIYGIYYLSSMSTCTSCPTLNTMCTTRNSQDRNSRWKHHMHRNSFISDVSSVKLRPGPGFREAEVKWHSFQSSKKHDNSLKFQRENIVWNVYAVFLEKSGINRPHGPFHSLTNEHPQAAQMVMA